MKFDHIVKYNGVFYAAGTDVPMEDKKPSVETVNPFVDQEPIVADDEDRPLIRKRGRAKKE